MPWRALTLRVDGTAAEAFSDALLEAGAQSVALEPGGAVVAILAPGQDFESLINLAAHAAGIAPPPFTSEMFADEDWVRKTQAQFHPIEIGARLWIGPSWREAPADRAAVRVDPGLAFGTGTHPTTQLVLKFLEKEIKGGERVLDYGCGSGILAIAAAKLGAAHVDGVDVDPQALETANANARANHVVLRAALPEELRAAVYDIVVSNILAQPLIVLAPLLAARTARRGRIALAGILESQGPEVLEAYKAWFDIHIAEIDDVWVLIAGTRR